MRTKDNILKELGKNRQPGAYGGIPQDTRDYILIEVLIDIRDILKTTEDHLETLSEYYAREM